MIQFTAGVFCGIVYQAIFGWRAFVWLAVATCIVMPVSSKLKGVLDEFKAKHPDFFHDN